MKILHKKLTSLLLSLILLITGLLSVGLLGGLQKETANAATNGKYDDKIYYFSDSKPVISDDDIKTIGNYAIVHDVCYLTSEYEFEYLLYTGYFWKFTGYEAAIIIQINSVTLDEAIWNALYECLLAQQLSEAYPKFMFITTENQLNIVDNTRKCYYDGFSAFLKKPFERCLCEENDRTAIKQNSALLAGATFFNRYGYLPEDALAATVINAPLMRLVNYICFGLNEAGIAQFEKSLYEELWSFYRDRYLNSYGGVGKPFDDPDLIDDLIKLWKESDPLDHTDFWVVNYDEYREFYYETASRHYRESNEFNEAQGRNIHLFVNVEGNVYFDVLNESYDTFESYEDLFDILNPERESNPMEITVCGMAAWRLDGAFYNFLYEAQQNAHDSPWNIERVPMYLWDIDNLQWGSGGLEVDDYEDPPELTEDELNDILGMLAEILGR